MIEPTILDKFAALPDSLKTEVVHYIDFLLEKYVQTSPQLEPPKKKREAGLLKGKIWMSDDFDAPLEDLKDYM
ncbi:MAG: DUF2281 domain-containing protein [Limnoraphis robusta]|uniref:DUF2281 domain-containing protein n=1 Tax=Limnoraphis robusta CS-951 TaxID=1637645 RepID=A0A0F5YDW8_9CYAN|nr:DUF2281 domain-containing protein [Limnoraphis robusta]KKD37074.1 hypothetical protein WN50_16465 [Limnoraphis robusta CS-951]KMW70329.1 hypothetical protein WN50_36130 [Limnoraphis robusta CS-951]